MKKIIVMVLVCGMLVLLAGCASSTGTTKPDENTAGQALVAIKTEAAPAIDGTITEDAWMKAKPITVSLKSEAGAEPDKIILRALYDNESVYLSAAYADATPLKIGEAWAFDGNSWTKGAYDDTLAFVWNMADSVPGFDQKGLGVMTTPLRNGLDVFDFKIDNPSDKLLHSTIDFWGW